MTAAALIRAGDVQPMQPWPGYLLSPEAWGAMAAALQDGPEPTFLGLWADTAHVFALFMDDAPLLASVRVEAGMFAALSPARLGAAPFERMVHDLWGHLAGNGADPRPLLDHGRWPVLRPLSARPVPNAAPPDPPELLEAAGRGLHQVPIGPVGDVMDPMHLRITAAGETLVRLEARLGYAHRGILALMRGKPPHGAAPLAARIAAGSTVAHAVAFARAAEAIAKVELPLRAHALRGVMAELERIASHLSDLGAMAPGLLEARCADLKENVLRASLAAFGHRLMMDCVMPGGVSADPAPAGMAALAAMLDRIMAAVPALRRGLSGFKGRTAAAGSYQSKRSAVHCMPAYAPYSRPVAAVPKLRADAVDARLCRCLAEIHDSTALLRKWIAVLPPGPIDLAMPATSGEGLGVADGPHGDVWHWLRLEAGIITANFACDSNWLQWPSIEAVCSGARLSNIPLILRSFGPAAAGLEL